MRPVSPTGCGAAPERDGTLDLVATLYRCKTPTDRLCPCGKVARRLRAAGIEYDQVRVRVLRRHRPEVGDLTGQRWVPVLVHGDDVIHDSRRILQHLAFVGAAPAEQAEREREGAR